MTAYLVVYIALNICLTQNKHFYILGRWSLASGLSYLWVLAIKKFKNPCSKEHTHVDNDCQEKNASVSGGMMDKRQRDDFSLCSVVLLW